MQILHIGLHIHVVGPCPHGIAIPQIEDGGTASNM